MNRVSKKLFFLLAACIILQGLSITPLAVYTVDGPKIGKHDLFVSPDGSDENDGGFGNPLASIEAAKELLKTKTDSVKEPVTVWLREGTYYLSSTLEFTSEDMPEVTFRPLGDEPVTVSCATPISGFEIEHVNGVTVFTKQLDTQEEGWYFNSLFSEKTTLNTPRFPKTGYFTVASVNTDDSLFTEENTPWELTTGQRSFNASRDDLKESFYNQSDVTVRILHYWKDELMTVTDFDESSGRVSLSRPSSMKISDTDRYYFENVFEMLDSPGEWYLNSVTGKLYYVPLLGEEADSLTLYSSKLDAFVSIDGVDDICFENISFINSAWSIPTPAEDSGWRSENNIDALQAALDVKGAFRVQNSDSLTIKNCDFRNIGSTAIKLERNVTNATVDSCYFENIGATGIFVGGDNVPIENDGGTGSIKLVNNEIFKYGRIFFNAVGIHITYCDTADVSNNEIHDGYYTGISCGWTWGYGSHATRNISIKNNLIYRIGQGVLSDMGGIYMLGIQSGTVISGNVIHNVAADSGESGYGGWGIYLDEGSSEMTVERNLVYCCGSQGLNIHYGEGNVFRNNISALNAEGQVSTGSRDEQHATAFYYNNIFLTDSGAPIYINMKSPTHFYDNGNLMWDLSNSDNLLFCLEGLQDNAIKLDAAVRDGLINNPVVADPMFTDVEDFDFTLSPDSPAFDMGFVEWDYSDAGTLESSTVGTTKHGGQTFAATASLPVELKSAHTALPIEQALCAIVGIMVFFCFSIVFAMSRDIHYGKLSRFRFSVIILSLIGLSVLGFGMYGHFVNWDIVAYLITSILFTLISAIPATELYILQNPESGKGKHTVAYILFSFLFAAFFFGLIYLLNNVMNIGSSLSCLSMLCLASLYETMIYFALLHRTGKLNPDTHD